MFNGQDFSELSEVEMAIYHFILANDDKIAFMRVRDIAEGSHTSPTSVMRFIRKSGYDSFPEFKLAIKQMVTKQPYGESALDDYFDILNRKNFKNDLELKIDLCADLIMEAGTSIFMGIGASGAIGSYASRKIANLGFNSFSLTDRTYPFKTRLSSDKQNVMFILSVSGNTVEMLDVIHQMRPDDRTKVVVITSDSTSPLACKADHYVDYVSHSDRSHVYHDLSSQIPCVFILELIINRIRAKQA
ncbi:MurR/RpiR family transcriptional regulator [Vagococcus sp. BWB3-3]|uniref:MurR/RpiR family transcriptional regulator n=1 Tax=Vagococcus allomyrinae TaxID=2794353 RepID=A0A940PBZ4_9ENTE|nr:MurR/RpiR family transcriptional regulator [Vagococcus allomyrinae]MBP1043306.1 MurR/RpiR family transcriptional regulator [Vagococcus allomyrinae]